MKRFLHVLMLAIALVGWAAMSSAQVGSKVFRIGFVVLSSPATTDAWMKAFRDELRKLGYSEGKNLIIESRFANGDRERLKDLVTELAALKVDVLLAPGEPALLAAKAYGQNIRIVTVTCDPLQKLLGSLARPGGNATGFTCISSDLGSKRLGLLKSLLPAAKRIAVLYSEPDNLELELQDLEAPARVIGVEIARYPVRLPENFDPAFKGMVNDKSDALYILASSFANLHRSKFAELALAYKIPSLYGFREFAEAGGLMSYGASFQDGFRRAAYQVDKILKGAPTSDIPVEQPTRFELVINTRTAKALGVEIPITLHTLADDMIE
jgi:putative ABC transport system substrate-binding protein